MNSSTLFNGLNRKHFDRIAVGTIVKDTNVLEVDLLTKFKAGDKIIIQTGGEQGGGFRGTMGVGGTPFPTFATMALMNASTIPVGLYASVIENGNTYQKSAAGVWEIYTFNGYYSEKMIPHALKATINSISAGKIYLDKTAIETAVNAEVSIDYYDFITNLIATNANVVLPEGKFSVGKKISITTVNGITQNLGPTIFTLRGKGAGKTVLYSPNGCESMSILFDGLHNLNITPEISDLTVIGCLRDKGFAFQKYPTTDFWEQSWLNNPAVHMASHGGRMDNLEVRDGFGYGILLSENNTANNCEVKMTDGSRIYNGWQVFIENNYAPIGSTINNVKFYSPHMTAGFEMFKSANCKFIDCKSVNGVCASNGSSNSLIRNMQIDITSDGGSLQPGGITGPIYVVNSLLGTSDGTTFENVNIKQVGYNGAAKTVHNAIQCGVNTKNVKIIGGLINLPDMVESNTVIAALLQADGAYIDGLTVIGTMPAIFNGNVSPYRHLVSVFDNELPADVKPNGEVKNTTADKIGATTGVNISLNNTAREKNNFPLSRPLLTQLSTPAPTIQPAANALTVNWNAIANATAYKLERSTTSDFSVNLNTIYTGAALTFNDTLLTAGKTYYYRLKATAAGYYTSNFGYASGVPLVQQLTAVLSDPTGLLRSSDTYDLGFKFTVGNSPVKITHLGFWIVSGNTQPRILKISNVAKTVNYATETINTNGLSVGYNYIALASPLVLAANTVFVIYAAESGNTDQFYGNYAPTFNSIGITLAGTVYGQGAAPFADGSTGNVQAGLNFKYQ